LRGSSQKSRYGKNIFVNGNELEVDESLVVGDEPGG
jgi:hypothetical protein